MAVHYRDFLKQLEETLGFSILSQEHGGSFEIRFDNDSFLTFELSEDQLFFDLYTVVAPWPDDFTEEAAAFLLEAHVFGITTANCYFGLDEDQLYLFTKLYLEDITTEKAKQCIQSIMNIRAFWSEEMARIPRLAKEAASGSSQEPSKEDTHMLYFQRV
jgi:hypothetical protein